MTVEEYNKLYMERYLTSQRFLWGNLLIINSILLSCMSILFALFKNLSGLFIIWIFVSSLFSIFTILVFSVLVKEMYYIINKVDESLGKCKTEEEYKNKQKSNIKKALMGHKFQYCIEKIIIITTILNIFIIFFTVIITIKA